MAFIPALPYIAAAFSALGAIAESNVDQAQAKSRANAAEMNTMAANQQADIALTQAGLEEEAQRTQARHILGDQRAAIAQAGTGSLSSTNQSLVINSAKNAEQDALNIRYGGLLEAHGYRVKSQQYAYEAKATRAQLPAMRASGYLNAFSSALSGYTSAGGKLGKT